jgi:leader peptidase (prepilin peptidase)/N-methyltransferase
MEIAIQVTLYAYVFFIGSIMGSFYNVVGIRIPEKESLLGRSHCPKCGRTLGWLELFPIVGYLVLKGHCKNCNTKISVKYPIMEFITGALFLVSFVILGQNVVEYILIIVFISLLVIITVSDMYYQIVPDIILIVFLPLILGLRMASPVIPRWDALIAAFMGFGFMYAIAWYGKKRFKQEALGGGDIKLYFIIGLVLGIDLVFLSVLFAAVLGLIYGAFIKKRNGYIPFVPFIFAGSMLAYYIGPTIIEWYLAIIY